MTREQNSLQKIISLKNYLNFKGCLNNLFILFNYLNLASDTLVQNLKNEWKMKFFSRNLDNQYLRVNYFLLI